MKTYRITSIKRKAERVGNEYLDDCRALADEWNEAEDRAVFSADTVAQIKKKWCAPKNSEKKAENNTSNPLCRHATKKSCCKIYCEVLPGLVPRAQCDNCKYYEPDNL